MEQLPHYQKDIRPWGVFERFTHNELSTVKLIIVKAGEAFSLQRHHGRQEFWRFISGDGIATIGIEQMPITQGLEVLIDTDVLHRVEATHTDVLFLEIAFGTFDENDIERIEDKYGRPSQETHSETH